MIIFEDTEEFAVTKLTILKITVQDTPYFYNLVLFTRGN